MTVRLNQWHVSLGLLIAGYQEQQQIIDTILSEIFELKTYLISKKHITFRNDLQQ